MSKSLRNLMIGASLYLVLAGTLGYFLWVENDTQNAIAAEIEGMRPEIQSCEATLAKREQITREKDEMENYFSTFVAYLPAADVRENQFLAQTIDKFLLKSGCVATQMTPSEGAQDPLGAQLKDFSRKVINLSMSGTFNQVRRFVELIEGDSQLLRVDSLTTSPTSSVMDGQKVLRVQVTVSLYFYKPAE